RGELRLHARRDAGRSEEALLHRVSEDLVVEFEEPDALRVSAPERAERGEPRIDSGPFPLNDEVARGYYIALATRPHDLRALVRTPARMLRVRRLVVENDEIANPEHPRRVRIESAGYGGRIGVLIERRVEAGPQVRGQFIHVVQGHRDLVCR